MPPRVARQWHARCISYCPSLSTQVRIRRHPLVLSRLYAQRSSKNGTTDDLGTANSAIIIPRSVHLAPEDIIRHIRPVHQDRLTQDRFAVFFVTPAFAHWLLDDEAFLRKALRQAYAHMLEDNSSSHERIHALCAVVDKLPAPRAIHNERLLESEALTRIKQPPISENGHEGIAYATLPFSHSVPRQNPALDVEGASISFISAAHVESGGQYVDTLRLPLANTVFQTGFTSTMTHSTWLKSQEEQEIILQEKRQVTQHGIRLLGEGTTNGIISALAVPLIPVTFPRRVDASMGNILRRVISSDGSSVTASQELESIVPRFFKARGESSHATTVWALVIPVELVGRVLQKTNVLLERKPVGDVAKAPGHEEDWEALWKAKPPHWSDLVPAALASGARLNRVLSGGGGWGKKAGLLSLDPMVTEQTTDSSVLNIDDESSDLSSALQQVINDGDYIQFFMSPSATASNHVGHEPETGRLEGLATMSTLWDWELGTIPSTIDALPGGSWQHSAPPSNDAFVFRHCFGALAEGGLTLHRRFQQNPQGELLHARGSKLDVPYSRFSALTTRFHRGVGDPIHSFPHSKCQSNEYALFGWSYPETSSPFLQPPSLDEFSLLPARTSRGDIGHKDTADIAILGNDREDVNARSKSNECTLPLTRQTLVLHKVLDGPLPSKQLFSFIRYVTITDEIDYCADKLRQVQKAVQQLTWESRLTLNVIMQYNNQPMDVAVKGLGKALSRPTKLDQTAFSGHISKIVMAANLLEMELDLLERYVNSIIKHVEDENHNDILEIARQIFLDTVRLRNQFSRIINFIILRAKLYSLTNNSAFTIYRMHTRLRWRLGIMINLRRGFKRRGSLVRALPALEMKLLKLRAYGSNLFFDKPAMSVPYIRQRLNDMEHESQKAPEVLPWWRINRRERSAATSAVEWQMSTDRLHEGENVSNANALPNLDGMRVPPQDIELHIRDNSVPRRVLSKGIVVRKYRSFEGKSIPLAVQDDVEDGNHASMSQIRRTVADELLSERQKNERKRKSKMALVNLVKGWLESVPDGETMGSKEEQKFWEKANTFSAPPAMDDLEEQSRGNR